MRTSRAVIEIALLEVEIPGAVLLRHQPALQPVGEAADHALQIGELLVEEGAQPVELLLVAKLLGADRLVEGGGEDLVVDLACGRLVSGFSGRRASPGVSASASSSSDDIVGSRVGASISPDCSSSRRRLRRPPTCDWSEPNRPRRPPRSFLALRLVVVCRPPSRRLLVVAEFLGHLHRGQHVAHDAGERLLVVELVDQPVDIGAGLLLDPVAPQIDDALAALGAARPVSRSRTISAIASSIGASALSRTSARIGLGVFVLEHGADDCRRRPSWRARRSPRRGLLDRVEDGARLLAFGRQLGWMRMSWQARLQRHGIAEAAGHRDVVATASSAARAAGARLPASAGRPWRSRLQLMVAGDGAHADGDRPAEAYRRRRRPSRLPRDCRRDRPLSIPAIASAVNLTQACRRTPITAPLRNRRWRSSLRDFGVCLQASQPLAREDEVVTMHDAQTAIHPSLSPRASRSSLRTRLAKAPVQARQYYSAFCS